MYFSSWKPKEGANECHECLISLTEQTTPFLRVVALRHDGHYVAIIRDAKTNITITTAPGIFTRLHLCQEAAIVLATKFILENLVDNDRFQECMIKKLNT